jgi:hypothetical protein
MKQWRALSPLALLYLQVLELEVETQNGLQTIPLIISILIWL